MPSNRIGRINEEIQRELAALIPMVKDPRVADAGMVSVTAVETTPDLKYAKIYVSALNKDNTPQLLKGLKSAAGWLRRELGRALNLRNTPELTFVRDDSIDKGAHILDMLRNPEIVKPANPANAHIVLDEEE
ncbi:MAG: 30S ribosome-binding factor RbfA [Oscillospiraceae bacterium]|jgi:ribosome-binding factor A|nr:30S ribosome-binding factor RbfA [Oscillospiraceae bacterium]